MSRLWFLLLVLVLSSAGCRSTLGHYCIQERDCEGTDHALCQDKLNAYISTPPDECHGLFDDAYNCWSVNSVCVDKKLYLSGGHCEKELSKLQEAGCPNAVTSSSR